MWFVLFALSPCVVKEAFFSLANAEYIKPINKTKSTAPTNCHYSQKDNQQISITKETNINKQVEPVKISENLFFVVRSTKIKSKYSTNSLGNSPPKYILYKRLKLDVV